MMSRLEDDIAVLARAHAIACRAIYPDGDQVSVPLVTLDHLKEELFVAVGRPAEYRLIRDEAPLLMQAARNLLIYREDKEGPLAERWRHLAEYLAGAIALDLENARKSLGAV